MAPTKPVLIVGGGALARECYYILAEVIRLHPEIHFCGFLSFDVDQRPDYKHLSNLYVGDALNYDFRSEEQVIIAIRDPKLKCQIHTFLKQRQVHLFNLIHPFSYISPASVIGEGNIFAAGVSISCNSTVGDCNLLNGTVIIGHDCAIGNYNFFGPFSQILGDVSIGDSNTIAVSSILLEHARVGDRNVIAPASVVYKGCRSDGMMQGNPALNVKD